MRHCRRDLPLVSQLFILDSLLATGSSGSAHWLLVAALAHRLVFVVGFIGYAGPLVDPGLYVGVFLMRSAGCVINDYADRHVDGFVRRTAQRPLPAGRLSTRQALRFFALLVLLAFLLVLTLNRFTILLSLVGLGLAILLLHEAGEPICHNWCWGWPSPGLFPWLGRRPPIPLTASCWWLFLANGLDRGL